MSWPLVWSSSMRTTSTSASRSLGSPARRLALSVILVVLLAGFAVVVAREVAATLGVGEYESNDSYQLFAVSLTGLAGGVFVIGMRPPAPTRKPAPDARFRSVVGAAYVLVYVVAGGTALVVCLWRLGDSTPLLRSLAAAFLGASVAAVSAFFGVEETDTSNNA